MKILINETTVNAQINNALIHAVNNRFNSAYNSLSLALDYSNRTKSELEIIDNTYAVIKY